MRKEGDAWLICRGEQPLESLEGRVAAAERLQFLNQALELDRRAFKPAVDFLAANWIANLREIAKTVGMSPFHFRRKFVFAFGETPKHMQTRHQLARAKTLLLTGKTPVEVAETCGFAHNSHLTNRFKALVGRTPGQWLSKQHASAGR